MHASRKTFWNVLFDNLFNVFNITTIVLLVIFVITKSYLYIIPLALSLIASVFSFVLDFKHYILTSKIDQKINVLEGDVEHEKTFANLKTIAHE